MTARTGYIIRCDRVEQDASGEVVALHCSVDLDTKSGGGGRGVKGTIQWVSASHGLPCEVRLYDRLFAVKNPGVGADSAIVDLLTSFVNVQCSGIK